MGLLADIYSASDTMKRKLGGLLADPVDTAGFYLKNMNEDAGKKLGLLSETFNGADGKPFSGPMSAKSRAAVDELSGDMVNAMVGQTVYHGSPHVFKKFDSSKIGTGEGAQVYGHGLYLAESRDVADSYAGMRPMAGKSHINGNPWEPQSYAEMLAESRLRGSGDYDKSIANVQKELDGHLSARNHDEAQGSIAMLEALKGMRKLGVEANRGNLYKADLSDQAIPRMLDWDKPLSEQSAAAQQLGKQVFSKEPRFDPNYTRGMELYHQLNAGNGPVASPQAAQLMRQAGIPGIRYLDGQSRGAGGTSNYVVFPGNEGLLQILERNGQPLK